MATCLKNWNKIRNWKAAVSLPDSGIDYMSGIWDLENFTE